MSVFRITCALAALVAALASGSARAQDSADETPTAQEETQGGEDAQDLQRAARNLYEAGTVAFERGNYEQALTYFTDGHEMSSRPAFLYNMGLCSERLLHLEAARDLYARYLAAMPQAENRRSVERRIDIIEAHLRENTTAESAVAELTDPELSEPVTQEPQEPQELGDGSAAEAEVQNPTREASASGGRSALGPALAFGVAGAGLVTFVVGALIASSRDSALEDDCAPTCNPDRHSEVTTPALVADIGLGVALAGAVVGTILLLVGRAGDEGDDDEASTTLGAAPRREGASVSLNVAF